MLSPMLGSNYDNLLPISCMIQVAGSWVKCSNTTVLCILLVTKPWQRLLHLLYFNSLAMAICLNITKLFHELSICCLQYLARTIAINSHQVPHHGLHISFSLGCAFQLGQQTKCFSRRHVRSSGKHERPCAAKHKTPRFACAAR